MYLPKVWILLLFFLLIHATLTAQKTRRVRGNIQVLLRDIKMKEALSYASVVILAKADSTFIRGGVSDADGNFNIQFPSQNGIHYLLQASYMGYTTVLCAISDTVSVFNVGNIVLIKTAVELGEVIVRAKIPDIKMVGDTTVINALAYRTPEGSYLQDLIKRIPGLEYDEKNNSLTYNGIPIQEINVNGEAFFSGNIRLALENLPVGLFSNLKVYNKLTDTELATGMNSGVEHYVLDLQTKMEFNRAHFASVKVGYGNNSKKDLEALFNDFRKGGENFSFIARSGNKNQSSIYKDNVTTPIAVNLVRKFGNKFTLTGNTEYNHKHNGNITTAYSEQYLVNTNQYLSSANEGIQEKRMISSSWNLLWKLNKRTLFKLSSGFWLNKDRNSGDNESATFSATPGLDIKNPFEAFDTVNDSVKINHSASLSLTSSRSTRYDWKVNFIRHLNKKGTNISFTLKNNATWRKNHSLSESSTTYFQLNNVAGSDSVLYRNQFQRSPSHTDLRGGGVSFTQPINKRSRLQFSYNYAINNESDNRDTYDLTTDEMQYIDSLSNRSYSWVYTHSIGLGFNHSDKKWTINTTMFFVPGHRKIERKVGLLHADTTLSVTNLSTLLRIGRKTKNYRIRFVYNGNTRQPSLSQLVPLTDNSNPLNITRGNPDLKRTFTHSFRLNVQNIRQRILTSLSWRFEQNSIVQAIVYEEQTGGRETYFKNIDGNWSLKANGNWWKNFGRFRVRVKIAGNYTNRVSLFSESSSVSLQRSVTRNMGVNTRLRLEYQPSWGGVNFDVGNYFRHSLNSLQNNSSYTRDYNFGLDTYVILPGNMQLRTDIAYSFRKGTNLQSNDNNELMWNFGISRHFLPGKQVELSLYWADILEQQKAYNRSVTSDGFYENYTQQIQGYVMVSLKYNFRLRK